MPDVAELIPLVTTLLAFSAFAGVLAGLLGVGGGIVLVPGYFYLLSSLGYDGPQLMQVCVATSLATIVVTSVRSVQSHHKKGSVNWDMLRAWTPGIALGAVVGVWIASELKSITLQGIFGSLGLLVGLYMAFGRPHWRLGDVLPRGGVGYVTSLVVGFLSVLMGIGGGAFCVPYQTLFNVPIHRAVATAAGLGALIAVPSAIGFLFVEIEPSSKPPLTFGAINLVAFGLTISMTLLTAPLGAKLAHWMDPKPLKRAFAFFLICVAGNMLRGVFFA